MATGIEYHLSQIIQDVEKSKNTVVKGYISRTIGLTLEAKGCQGSVGTLCQIINPNGQIFQAQIIGFNENTLYLMPTNFIHGICLGAKVLPLNVPFQVPVGKGLLGRVLDGNGVPIDGKGDLNDVQYSCAIIKQFNPLERGVIQNPLDVGVQAINGLLTVGMGQRIGLVAGSGVGKSVLLGMITRFTQADVVVVALIGERGREVNEFILQNIGEKGLTKTVVVAAPADSPPLQRINGACFANRIADGFRAQGLNVLLIMDSLTRYAQAQREVGLALGEPPTAKGYPPSVFFKVPQLVEQAGLAPGGKGSVTGIYTVLAEGDDSSDPIVDSARAILDGHIVLSRKLAEQGHYPAIDLEQSISRVMENICKNDHKEKSRLFKKLISKYNQNKDFITLGAYQKGSDFELDYVLAHKEIFDAYLTQSIEKNCSFKDALSTLSELIRGFISESQQTKQSIAPKP